jgi:hypothetical protein
MKDIPYNHWQVCCMLPAFPTTSKTKRRFKTDNQVATLPALGSLLPGDEL